MAKAETGTLRAPRGTKPVSAAFFSALDAAPEAQRTAIARAAQDMIREELKHRREKTKAASDRARANGKPAAKAAPARKAAAVTGKSQPAATTAKATRKSVPVAQKAAAKTGSVKAAGAKASDAKAAGANAPGAKAPAKRAAAAKPAAAKAPPPSPMPADDAAELMEDASSAKSRRAPKPAAETE